MKNQSLYILVLLVFGWLNSAVAGYVEWDAVQTPSPQPTHIYGGYAKGCISGATELPIDGVNYSVVNLEQKRNYGHPAMIQYLYKLSQYVRRSGTPQILIEDIGGPRGGPFERGHASHQNGLDVDISYYMPNTFLTLGQRAKRPEVSFVENHQRLSSNWGWNQVVLTIGAIVFPEVDRVFVSPVIKKYFCEHFQGANWLYKIRPWYQHEDHIHVRLKCPANEVDCVSQPLNPKDTMCGASLNQWLRNVATKPAKSSEPEPAPVAGKARAFPVLPPQCNSVRTD